MTYNSDMTSFLQESPARQLGALAATLGRISSSAEKVTRSKLIIVMLDECLRFIEWTIPNQTESTINELQTFGVMLKLWRDSWEHAQVDEHLRALLSVQAKQWSDRALELSGLL